MELMDLSAGKLPDFGLFQLYFESDDFVLQLHYYSVFDFLSLAGTHAFGIHQLFYQCTQSVYFFLALPYEIGV